MRALLALLLLLPLAAAATPDSFVQPFLQPGEFTYSRPVTYANHPYHIVWVNATETFVLDEAAPGTFSFVNSSSLIYGVLLQDFLNNLEIGQETSNLNQKLNAFNSSRQPREGNCEIETGTDHLPCYDSDTCFQACLSVPACRASIRPELVQEILLWRNNESMLEANLTTYAQQVAEIGRKTDQIHVYVSSAESQIAKVLVPVSAIQSNKLFSECPMCFNSCHPIPFNVTALNSSRNDLASIRGKLGPMANLSERAEKLRQRTYARTMGSTYDVMVFNMTDTFNGLHSRVKALLPLRDSALDYNLTRLNNTLQMVIANGSSKHFDEAFALEPEFYALATPIDARIRELKLIKDRYDAMHADVEASLFNATANANNALSQINDSRLGATIGRMRALLTAMESLANRSDMLSALELRDDFDYESVAANGMIINITESYASLTRARESNGQQLFLINAKLRANHTAFRQEYEGLSARFDGASTLMRPPMRQEDVAPAKAELAAIAQSAADLSGRIDTQKKREDWAVLKAQFSLYFKTLFFRAA